MPFLGQDWRAPGEQWVRTDEGWERMKMWRFKLLELLNETRISKLLQMAAAEGLCVEMENGSSKPFVYIVKDTKEQKMQLSLAEAFNRLHMSSAVRDLRRCNYICKLLELLVKQRLVSLSGAAQKIVFNLMEELSLHVNKTQNNVRMMQSLLDEVKAALYEGRFNHLGSSNLWQQHHHALNRMQGRLDSLQLTQRADDGAAMLTDLPSACLYRILLHLADHRDIARVSATDRRTQEATADALLWRRLCRFHFDAAQARAVLRRGETDIADEKILFVRLYKRYGLKDVYEEMLHLCRHCNCLFWQLHGHPCLISNMPPKSTPISPAMCMQLFTS